MHATPLFQTNTHDEVNAEFALRQAFAINPLTLEPAAIRQALHGAQMLAARYKNVLAKKSVLETENCALTIEKEAALAEANTLRKHVATESARAVALIEIIRDITHLRNQAANLDDGSVALLEDICGARVFDADSIGVSESSELEEWGLIDGIKVGDINLWVPTPAGDKLVAFLSSAKEDE